MQIAGTALASVAAGLFGFGVWLVGTNRTTPPPPSQFTDSVNSKLRIQQALAKLPLYFVENRGQLNTQFSYYLHGRETSVYFADDGLMIALAGRGKMPERWAVKLEFIGANPDVEPAGQDRTAAAISYFKGPRHQWKTGLATYSSVLYSGLWTGIDLRFSGTADRLKYEYVVQPGARVESIRLRYRGAERLHVDEAGRLEVHTPVGRFHDERPYAYQEVDGRQVEVPAAYELDGHGYGFRLGEYDRSRPLVLDPAILVYAGFIGGAGDEAGLGIAVDNEGNAYVAGVARLPEPGFPAAVGPDLSFNGGDEDAFVAKVNAAGTELVYAGYIGGAGLDEAYGIAVDKAGNAYVAGYSGSGEATFPVTGGPDLTYGGGDDAFVAKVNAEGTALIYCGCIGGISFDYAYGVAVDGEGNAYVAGYTGSSEATFPVMVGPDLTYNGGDHDGFVAKINAEGTALVYAGYIGGAGLLDRCQGIAVDASGAAYVVGRTTSNEASFPVIMGPDLTFNGSTDAFVAKVNPEGTALVYAGYIGGGGNDQGFGIAVDAAGAAYVTGWATSTAVQGFPVLVGPNLIHNGGNDAFVAKVNPEGSALVYAGYIGGSGNDQCNGIAVDAAGNAYVAGVTTSSESTFPATGGPDLTHNGDGDVFIAMVNAEGSALQYAGYIGGQAYEQARGLALDCAGSVYLTGRTFSTESTFPAIGGPDLTHNGGGTDAFVAKVRFESETKPELPEGCKAGAKPSEDTNPEAARADRIRGLRR